MKDFQDAIARTAKHLAKIGQVIIDALEGMTPEQRAAIESLAENPKVAEALQELNQKLAKQKATGETTRGNAQPIEPLIEDDDARDAVRLWASTLEIHEVRCEKTVKGVEVITFEAYTLLSAPRIEFASWSLDADVAAGGIYTIEELCGEDETPEPLEPTYVDLDERIMEKEGKAITLGEPGSFDMVAEFETGQVRLCAAGDSYYDNFVSFDDFLGFAEELKEALEKKK